MRFDPIRLTAALCVGLFATGCAVTHVDWGKTASKAPRAQDASAPSAGYVPDYADAFKMKYGLFIHWVGSSPVQRSGVKRPDGSPYEPGTIDEYAHDINVEAVADDIQKLGFEYVMITDFHGFGTMLHPSAASDRWRGKGYASERDVIGEMILALKKRGIGFILFTHPLCGHIYADAEELGWNDPTDGYKRWNDFVNEVYAELVERYGADLMGIGFDSEFGLSRDKVFTGKLDLPRLRETILSKAPHLPLIGLAAPNAACEFGHKEIWRADWHEPWNTKSADDYDINRWPVYRRVTSVVVPDHWTTIKAADLGMTHLNAEELYRYSVIQSAAATEGPGNAWAASPYPDASWEKNVREVFAQAAQYMKPVRQSLTCVYTSSSYPTPEGAMLSTIAHGVVATRSIDDATEYIHVLNPPTGKTLRLGTPQDGKRFTSARLLASGRPVKLRQDANEVELVLGENDEWHPLNTVIALSVDRASIPRRSLALHRKATSSSVALSPVWPPHAKDHGLIRVNDGLRHAQQKPVKWSSALLGWSSEPRSAPATEWVGVDLGKVHSIREVHLYPRDDEGHEGEGFPVDLSVEVSADGTQWQTIASRARIPQGSEPLVLEFKPVNARHVRVVGTKLRQNPQDGLYSMQIVEMELF
jgi:hypothetical protein